jgi:hypothetical protein
MRRIWSVAQVTFREALHNKVLLSCAFFALMVALVRVGIFAVGGPDLRLNVEHFTRVAFLVILLTGVLVAIVTVAPSLSQDIRSKVIHTIIPKPIHRVEILLGKVLGFTGTVAVILLIIGGVTWALLRLTVPGGADATRRGLLAAEVRMPAESARFAGGYLSAMKRSERRWIYPDWIETPEERKQREADRVAKGEPGEALLSFPRIRPGDVGGDVLRLELNVGVYRFGGGAGEPAELSILVKNLETGAQRIVGRRGPDDQEGVKFTIPEDQPAVVALDVAAFLGDGAPIDVAIRNLTPRTRVGIKRTDVTLLLADRSYEVNFFKALVLIFLEIFVVVVIAVMASTFLTGIISILFTLTIWIGGHLLGYVGGLLTRYETPGHGMFAEFSREFGRTVLTPSGPFDWLIDFLNALFNGVLTVISYVFPNFSHFDGAWLVATNVDIGADVLGRAAAFSLFYAAVCFLVAYACFRDKEVAR